MKYASYKLASEVKKTLTIINPRDFVYSKKYLSSSVSLNILIHLTLHLKKNPCHPKLGQALSDDPLKRLKKLGFVLSNEMKYSTFDFVEVFTVRKRKFPKIIERNNAKFLILEVQEN